MAENISKQECLCCKLFAKTMQLHRNLIENDRRQGTTEIEFLAALKTQMKYNGFDCGSVELGKFPLNYCPACGTKIEQNYIKSER